MKLKMLRGLLILDAALLFILGAVLILVPGRVEQVFHFHELPPAVGYMIGMWGCVFATIGFGYLAAATNPIRHRVWIQVGIARGALECGLGLVYLARGIVTFQQAGFGVIAAATISIAYILLYPRQPRLVSSSNTQSPAAP